MNSETGKQMASAIQAVLHMHSDCTKLLLDLDKSLRDYRPLFGNVVTSDLGSSISRRTFIASGLFRHYFRNDDQTQVLGVNVCFFTNDGKFTEPLFIVARLSYYASASGPERLDRGWDPWYAFLDWNPERKFNAAIFLDGPLKNGSVERVALAACPLLSVSSLEVANGLIDLVGRP
jgi:hypothetical protein